MNLRPAAFALIAALAATSASLAQAPPPAGPTAAAAPAGKVNPDLLCMLVANGLSGGAKDANTKQSASMMMIFYLGRVDRGTPNLDLGPALKAQAQLAQATQGQPAKVQAEVQSCVNKFNGRMNALGALSRPAGSPAGASPPPPPPAPK
jgi:hypothetical protein